MTIPTSETPTIVRNALRDKWPMLARVGAWMFIFVFAFMMLLINFVEPRGIPLHWRIAPLIPKSPAKWWAGLGASFGTALFVSEWLVLMMALFVRAYSFLVYSDRLQVRMGPFKWNLPFKDITAVESVSFVPWPRLGSFWQDLRLQIQTTLLTPRYQHLGLGQSLRPRATLVRVKVRGRRWWRGYFLDVDNPDQFLATLNQALGRYRAAEAQLGGTAGSSSMPAANP